jgi:hypothetical protein
MAPALFFLASVLAATQPTGSNVRNCLGISVPVSGHDTALLDDAAVAALRRFAAGAPVGDYRIRFVVFAPYGFNRGTTVNRQVTRLRGEVIRAHLIAAGLPGDRIRVMQLGEHAHYPFPPTVEAAEAADRRGGGPEGPWGTAGLVIVELPPESDTDCRLVAHPSE